MTEKDGRTLITRPLLPLDLPTLRFLIPVAHFINPTLQVEEDSCFAESTVPQDLQPLMPFPGLIPFQSMPRPSDFAGDPLFLFFPRNSLSSPGTHRTTSEVDYAVSL